jgi:uncharacterized membrane protein
MACVVVIGGSIIVHEFNFGTFLACVAAFMYVLLGLAWLAKRVEDIELRSK